MRIKERNVLFNDALNTFYLRLYGVRHMVKDHSDSHMGYSFQLAARVLLYASSHRQDNTYHGLCYTSSGALAGTRNGSVGPPCMIDLTTHHTMSERSYHGATSHSYCVRRHICRAGCSSVDSVPAFEAVGRQIDPSQWTQLQFGLFSIPTSGPQLVYQRLW